MPSVKATKKQIEMLGEQKVNQGWRLRPAFEIDFMMKGKQVVLPPSIHPDTNKKYMWSKSVKTIDDIPIYDVEEYFDERHKKGANAPIMKTSSEDMKGWQPVDVDFFDLDMKLSPRILGMLYEGEEVDDRSAGCFSVAMAMLRAKYSEDTIMTVLTDKSLYLGNVAYEHAKTQNRARAARWIKDYSIQKARTQVDAAYIFDCEVEYTELTDEEVKANEEELKKTTNWMYSLDRSQSKDGLGSIKPSLYNAEIIFKNAVGEDMVTYDAFTMRESYGVHTPWGGRPGDTIDDSELVKMKLWLAQDYGTEPNVNTVNEAVDVIGKQNAYHPVREYLDSLDWDGTPRIDTWMRDLLGVDMPEPYLSEVSRKFLIAAVARIMDPGVKFDHMVVFQGKQGLGKSSIGSILATPKWFSDNLSKDLSDKDAALGLVGIWITEMAELSSMRKNEVEVVKAFITRQIDKFRPPYGRRTIEAPRQNIFFGTTNADEFLTDNTGNRRFWPVKVESVNFEGLHKWRDQLWAEAVYKYYIVGEQLYLSKEAEKQVAELHEDRMVMTEAEFVEEAFLNWIEKMKNTPKSPISAKTSFSISDLFDSFWEFEAPFATFRNDNKTLQTVSRLLRKHGFEKFKSTGLSKWRLI